MDEDQQTSIEEKLSRQTLVLNRGFLPIQVTSVRHALELLFQGRAKVVTQDYLTYSLDEWIVNSAMEQRAGLLKDSDTISGVSAVLGIPRVITLTDYEHIPRRAMRFRRRDVFSRDDYTCQYCGHRFTTDGLTIDHVLPRSKGGITSWENCVTSCKPCNTKKADRTPEEARMPLRGGPPKKPNAVHHFTQKIQGDPTWNKFV